MDFEYARRNMIEQQIRPWDVLDQEVLDLLAEVRREDFVPAEHRTLAFTDMEIPLTAAGAARGEVMLHPKLEARLLQELMLRRHESVLEIGAGSGHMAALLAHRGRDVLTVDINPELAALAAANLKRAGVTNARVAGGNGLDHARNARFDAIVLSGSVSRVPESLLRSLAVGGRLIGIVGDQPVMSATLVTRAGEEAFVTAKLFESVAPRLLAFPEPDRFRF